MTKSAGAIGYTLFTLLLPLIAALFAFPYLIATYGAEKFGYLGLFWVLVGYFSIFDLGLGRVLTREIAVCIAEGRIGKVRPTVLHLLRLMALLSAIGAFTVALLAQSPVTGYFATDAAMRQDLALALLWLAAGLPAVILFAAIRGLLEAMQQFRTAATLRAIIGTWSFLGPVLAARIDTSLATAIMIIVLFRIVALLPPAILLYRIGKARGYWRQTDQAPSQGLLAMAGWMSVSNVISPVMVYCDRFILAVSAGPVAVAQYAAPFDILSRLAVFPEALFSVLFPKIARDHATGAGRLGLAHHGAERVLFIFIATVAALAVMGGQWGLSVWLGPDFAAESWQIMLLLTAGLVPNFTARAAFNTLQAAGHARATAIIHLCELPVYLPLVVALITGFGAAGAAAAWSLRALMDFLLLRHMLGRRVDPALRRRSVDVAVIAVACLVATSAFLPDPLARALIGGGLLALLVPFGARDFRRLRKAMRGAAPMADWPNGRGG